MGRGGLESLPSVEPALRLLCMYGEAEGKLGVYSLLLYLLAVRLNKFIDLCESSSSFVRPGLPVVGWGKLLGRMERKVGWRREKSNRGRGWGGGKKEVGEGLLLASAFGLVPSVAGIIDNLTLATLSLYPDTFPFRVLDFFPPVAHAKEFTKEESTRNCFSCQDMKYILTFFFTFVLPPKSHLS